MSTPGTEPVGADELIYRRVPVSKGWYSAGGLSPEAFEPRDDEDTGISVYRSKYKSLPDAAKGLSKRGYYVAVIRASDLIAKGIDIAPRPILPDDPGHAELPALTAHSRDSDEAIALKSLLSELATVEGPFVPSPG